MGNRIVVIGATNTDIAGQCLYPMVLEDSNIGTVTISIGGVGHNTAMNLAKLGEDVTFITALGSDILSYNARKEMENLMDISSSLIAEGRSGVYLYVADENGDMHVAVNDMSVTDKLTKEFIEEKREIIENSPYLVLDANLREETIHTASSIAKGKVIIDAVSTLKVPKLKSSLSNIDVLKLNRMELETLSELPASTEAEIKEASLKLLSLGVKAVITTVGSKGAYYLDKSQFLHSEIAKVRSSNTNGCGDAFLSGFVSALSRDIDIKKALKFASATAGVAAESADTIAKNMEKSLVQNLAKEIKVEELS